MGDVTALLAADESALVNTDIGTVTATGITEPGTMAAPVGIIGDMMEATGTGCDGGGGAMVVEAIAIAAAAAA